MVTRNVRNCKKIYSLEVFFIALVSTLLSVKTFADGSIQLAESHLIALKYDFATLKLESCADDNRLKQIIADSIARKILLVQSSNPSLNKLNGESLENLCLATESTEILSFASSELTGKAATLYLNSVQPHLREIIQELQKTMLGSGCYISPRKTQL